MLKEKRDQRAPSTKGPAELRLVIIYVNRGRAGSNVFVGASRLTNGKLGQA